MTIVSEMPFRRSKREDGQHTGSLVLDQHRKASVETPDEGNAASADGEESPSQKLADQAREKSIPVT